jgi:outer membrane beta-barrel protein
MIRHYLLSVILAVCFLFPAGGGPLAQTLDMKKAPVVKRNIGWRTARSELSLHLGSTIEDPYFRNMLMQVGYNYHLLNWLSFGGNLGYAFPLKTPLAEDIEAQRSSAGKSFSIPATHFGFMAEAHMQLIPLFGKSMIANSFVLAYDFHFILGAAAVQVLWNNDVRDRILAEAAIRPAGVVGAGVRLFLNRSIAINLEVKDYICQMYTYGNIDMSVPAEGWENNVAFTLGFSMFMPAEVGYENE